MISLDPTSSDFYSYEYILEWEDEPISAQLGGYFINYNNNQSHNEWFALWWTLLVFKK